MESRERQDISELHQRVHEFMNVVDAGDKRRQRGIPEGLLQIRRQDYQAGQVPSIESRTLVLRMSVSNPLSQPRISVKWQPTAVSRDHLINITEVIKGEK